MSHPSYASGYRHEKRCQAWLVHLGECIRSMMSRGADLILTKNLRRWTVSCKCGAKGKIRYATIREELETHDLCMTATKGDPFPMVHIYAPKFIEICGGEKAE